MEHTDFTFLDLVSPQHSSLMLGVTQIADTLIYLLTYVVPGIGYMINISSRTELAFEAR